jgi:hypothetical protein
LKLNINHLHKVFLLPFPEQWLLVKVTFLLAAIWVGLRLMTFNKIYRLLVWAGGDPSRAEKFEQSYPDQVVTTIHKASRILGENSCLSQALAGQLLLIRHGYESKLHIGVLKENGKLYAHAWLEREGMTVIGGPESEIKRYTLLHDLDKIKS